MLKQRCIYNFLDSSSQAPGLRKSYFLVRTNVYVEKNILLCSKSFPEKVTKQRWLGPEARFYTQGSPNVVIIFESVKWKKLRISKEKKNIETWTCEITFIEVEVLSFLKLKHTFYYIIINNKKKLLFFDVVFICV